MSCRVIIEPTAAAETEEAYRWIAEQSPTAAAKWFNDLGDSILALANTPQRCPLAPENDAFEEEIRQLLHGERQHAYRILFKIVDDAVHVLHVRHGARQYLKPPDEDE